MNRGLPQWLVSVIIMSSCAALSLIMLAINRFIRFFQMRSAGAFPCPQTIKKEVVPAATTRLFALVGLDTPPNWAGCDLGCMRLSILTPCTNAFLTLKPRLNGQYGRMACANKPPQRWQHGPGTSCLPDHSVCCVAWTGRLLQGY